MICCKGASTWPDAKGGDLPVLDVKGQFGGGAFDGQRDRADRGQERDGGRGGGFGGQRWPGDPRPTRKLEKKDWEATFFSTFQEGCVWALCASAPRIAESAIAACLRACTTSLPRSDAV